MNAYVQHFEESYRVYCTLLRGTRRSLLFDTGLGQRDLRPLLDGDGFVCNSHGHADHTGGNFRFETVYLHPADWALLPAEDQARLRPLRAGQTFDLGGVRACAVPLTGHTRGSVGLLLPEERLLLAGDALSPRLLLCEAGALARARETLRRIAALPFDTFLASHYPNPLPRAQVDVHLRHLDRLRIDPATRRMRFGTPLFRSVFREGQIRSEILFSDDTIC